MAMKPFSSIAGRGLSPLEIDWLRILIHIYGADRMATRTPIKNKPDLFWSRTITVNIPVSEPLRWNETSSAFQETLSFLTGDRWRLQFSEQTGSYAQQQVMKPAHDLGTPLLFSGGLDSLIGAISLLEESTEQIHLISGATHPQLEKAQQNVVGSLRREFGDRINHSNIEYGFRGTADRTKRGKEATQRCRGLVHAGLGMMAAHLSQRDSFTICENGIGAFNLPASYAQQPGSCSLSVHPLFLQRLGSLFSQCFQTKISVKQPALFKTKGEMSTETLSGKNYQFLIRDAFSCEKFPNYRSRKMQCGKCSSCLIRRAALLDSGEDDPGSDYDHDFLGEGLPQKKSLHHGYDHLQAYCARMNSVINPPAQASLLKWEFPELIQILPELSTALGLEEEGLIQNIGSLNRHFLLEWNRTKDQIAA